MNLLGKDRLLNDPGEIGSFNTTVANGTCNSKTRRFRPRTGLIQKTGYDLAEFPMFPAGEDAFRNQFEVPIFWLKISQPGIGPTNIAGQNHFSKFLQRRPSRSNSSSASFGPQVPEA